MAELIAAWSKDPDRKVGAVLVSADRRRIAVGYNGFPRGIDDSQERLGDRELKNALTVHAERNVLDNASFERAGCTLYVTRFPCVECAKGIIQCGLRVVVAPKPDLSHPRWGENWGLAASLLTEAGVDLRLYAQKGDAGG
jgi:dCMP deaminase